MAPPHARFPRPPPRPRPRAHVAIPGAASSCGGLKFEEVGGYALLNRFCECVAWSREFSPGPIFGPASPHNFGRVCPKCNSFLSGDSHDLPYHDVPSRKYQVFGFICP